MVKILKYTLLALITSIPVSASWYVDNQATGNNNGTSW